MGNERDQNKPKTDRKLGMSCAECRRSKLKCDRSFPCSACVRRGCANICPDGTLAATKGNKVLQSQNETLLQNVKRMSSRIRELEAALGKTQAQISPQPHPLLQESERLKDIDQSLYEETDVPKDGVEEASDLVGSLSIGDQGQARFHGQSSASEFLQTLLPNSDEFQERGLHSKNLYKMGLPQHIIELVTAFPFNAGSPTLAARQDIVRYLPQHKKALQLSLGYFEHAGCTFQVLQQDIFVRTLLDVLLSVANGTIIGDQLHAHQVALIYLVLALGSHLGDDHDGQLCGEKYFLLACAALSINPIVKEATTTTVQALFVMVQYFNCVDSPSCERRWLLAGIMYRLSYSIGLQRDPALWNLSPEEVHLRRMLFWELYAWDAWSSIIYGRPPSLNIAYTDCHFPEDKSSFVNARGEREMGFESYKHRFAAFVLAPVVEHVFGVRHLKYDTFMSIDTKLRKLPPPSWLLAPTRGNGEPVDGRSWNPNSTLAMQQYYIVCARESTLLYIHRRYFATAIRLNSQDPLKTKYGASVMAVTRSACLLLASLRSLWGVHPAMAAKQQFFWSGAFSSIIVLSCIVYNSPGCGVASDALRAMCDGVELYKLRVFDDSASSVKLLSSVRTSVQNMFQAYQEHHRLGKPGDFVVKHEAECTTMRILEGSTVVINMNEIKMARSSSGSADGSNASSPESGSEPPEPSHLAYDASHGEGAYVANDQYKDVPDEEGTRLLAFSGVYYTPDAHQHMITPPSVYAPLEETAHVPVQNYPDHANVYNTVYSGYNNGVPVDSLLMEAPMPPYGAPGMQFTPASEPNLEAYNYYSSSNGANDAGSSQIYQDRMGNGQTGDWVHFMNSMGVPNQNI